jgi:multisubunit Na+/H+ antiporter MnhE subunit
VKQIVLGVALVLLWAAITANFSTPNLALGALVALGALAFLRRSFSQPVRFRKLRSIAGLTLRQILRTPCARRSLHSHSG